MLGLAATLAVPVLALLGLFARLLLRFGHRRRPLRSTSTVFEHPPLYLKVEGNLKEHLGSPAPGYALSAGLTRIGRHEDNDICLNNRTVHRYHASVERSLDAGCYIRDLSGPDGNGVRLNGQRIDAGQVASGDIVELGQVRLRFVASNVENIELQAEARQ